jgi:hypothetical protein
MRRVRAGGKLALANDGTLLPDRKPREHGGAARRQRRCLRSKSAPSSGLADRLVHLREWTRPASSSEVGACAERTRIDPTDRQSRMALFRLLAAQRAQGRFWGPLAEGYAPASGYGIRPSACRSSGCVTFGSEPSCGGWRLPETTAVVRTPRAKSSIRSGRSPFHQFGHLAGRSGNRPETPRPALPPEIRRSPSPTLLRPMFATQRSLTGRLRSLTAPARVTPGTSATYGNPPAARRSRMTARASEPTTTRAVSLPARDSGHSPRRDADTRGDRRSRLETLLRPR